MTKARLSATVQPGLRHSAPRRATPSRDATADLRSQLTAEQRHKADNMLKTVALGLTIVATFALAGWLMG